MDLDFVDELLRGDHRALAKAISLVENNDSGTEKLLKRVYSHGGGAWVVGFTGPPGTGKSTLLSRVAAEYRSRGLKIGVLAFDPTSPVTGGAFLGDRLRMTGLASDPHIFIRSMATRGGLGGLTEAARSAVRLLDASGKEIVFVETAGAGQADVEISTIADVVVVVLMPSLGDEVQMSKAGLVEVGGVFVVNKADLPHADRLVADLKAVLKPVDGWNPVVLKTIAVKGTGVTELVKVLEDFRMFAGRSGWRDRAVRKRLSYEILEEARKLVSKAVEYKVVESGELRSIVEKCIAKKTDPHTAARRLVRSMLKEGRA